jgi:hypothetical protein
MGKLILQDVLPKLRFIHTKKAPRKLLSKTLLRFGKLVIGNLHRMNIFGTLKI